MLFPVTGQLSEAYHFLSLVKTVAETRTLRMPVSLPFSQWSNQGECFDMQTFPWPGQAINQSIIATRTCSLLNALKAGKVWRDKGHSASRNPGKQEVFIFSQNGNRSRSVRGYSCGPKWMSARHGSRQPLDQIRQGWAAAWHRFRVFRGEVSSPGIWQLSPNWHGPNFSWWGAWRLSISFFLCGASHQICLYLLLG